VILNDDHTSFVTSKNKDGINKTPKHESQIKPYSDLEKGSNSAKSAHIPLKGSSASKSSIDPPLRFGSLYGIVIDSRCVLIIGRSLIDDRAEERASSEGSGNIAIVLAADIVKHGGLRLAAQASPIPEMSVAIEGCVFEQKPSARAACSSTAQPWTGSK
jgi:hypothetical protein